MTALTEFLLARIAEDEAGCSPGHASWCEEAGCTCGVTRTRVLAECAAKRRIVEHAIYAETITKDDVDRAYRLGQWHGYKSALRDLASVYADHPDYREEFKP